MPSEYDMGLANRKAIFRPYAQAIPGAFAISKFGTSPCRAKCPAHVSVQGFIALTRQGKYHEALKLFKMDHPFPGVCGRVCNHACEGACTRNSVDQPLAIMHIHRFLADTDRAGGSPYVPAKKAERDEKVAIIGAGPAGLSCAYFLAIEGYKVTVFEKLPIPGGMLTVGIPAYRLPRDVTESEVQVIKDLGVEFKTGVEIGTDLTIGQLREKGYKAFFVAIGAHKSRRLNIEGEDCEGDYPAVEFTQEVNLGKEVSLGDRVAVIGGGNVAMDAVRTALRIGSKNPFIIYRRAVEQMPADPAEIQECREEGIEIMTLTSPTRIIAENGKVKAIECIRMELGPPDDSGRQRPVPIEGSEFTIEVDAVIPAIGQEIDWSCLTEECACTLSKKNTMEVDKVTLQTSDPDIFCGGDAVTGPATVVEAIAAGKEAAVSIDRYLRGKDLYANRKTDWRPVEDVPTKGVEHVERNPMNKLEPEERIKNFNEVQLGFNEETAKAEANRCLECGGCCECYQCVATCEANAVTFETHEQKPETITLNTGAVILAPGSKPFDPSDLENYGYSRLPNVVTSLEFERILSSTGPYMGRLQRPSDGVEPTKIAWLQCIGSRDINRCDNGYCSSVCCMYALKEAIVAKEHIQGNLDATIFFMDMRTFGKDYEKYYQKAKEQYDVRFVRSRIHTLNPAGSDDQVCIEYSDEEGRIHKEVFDMVVLSVGMEIAQSTKELAQRLGIELYPYGFSLSPPLRPVHTSRPGIYACGLLTGPKDIPESVMEASAAACAAQQDLAGARGTKTETVHIHEQLDVFQEQPRIGVFVCKCGTNIGGIVDVPAVARYAASFPHVVHVEENLFTCSQDTQDRIKDVIKEKRLNRVVVAACSPNTHEPLFQETIEACGLNKYLFEMANIRNQDSWVHSEEPHRATEKAKDLVRMAVARASLLKPLMTKSIPVNQRALVIGGGVAGMTAALSLANQGYEVVIVEKEPNLGGLARELTVTIEGWDISQLVSDLVDQVTHHERIQVLTEALGVGFTGFKGNFTTEVMVGPGMYERKINHGVVILATGANEYTPKEFFYGQDPRIMTQIELAKRIELHGASDMENVVMIQCVGSRNDENPNCSRVCCQSAIKNALHIKEQNPDANVFILYRDIRTYGLMEDYYRRAREEGVIFCRFEPDDPPKVTPTEDGIRVMFTDHILKRQIQITADVLALSAGMVAQDTEELASILKVNRTVDGYFMEAHVKLRPVEMASEGIFVCGTAHGPKLVSESIAQAMAAASRAATLLAQPSIELSPIVARVDQEHCAACLVCVRSCPYGVPRINKQGVSEIDEALCHGCGICAAECPANAIQLGWYEDDQVMSELDALLEDIPGVTETGGAV